MSAYSIKVEGLGKRYRIGRQVRYRTLRDEIQTTSTRLMRKLRGQGRRKTSGGYWEEETHIWALKEVSFEITPGISTGIIGSNGAGKTTLLKLLSHITVPTRGSIRLRGRVGSLLEVGTGFHPELTGRENIYLNGAILGMRKQEIDRKFDEIVAFSEIEKFLDTPIKFYSSGMSVRLAFSVAAHLEPEILLLDEVLAVGDMNFQKKSLAKMGDVVKGGRTVLFVSHNLAAVRALCQEAIYLEHGETKFIGGVDAAVDTYMGRGQFQSTPQVERAVDEKKSLQITAISIAHQNGASTDRILHDEPFEIRMRMVVRKAGYQVVPTIQILDSEFTPLVSSSQFEHPESESSTYPVGIYDFIIKVPSPLLIPGRYRLNASLLHKGRRQNWVADSLENVCPFEVEDNGSPYVLFGIERSGKLTPHLEWVQVTE